jgi:hypothetical protein
LKRLQGIATMANNKMVNLMDDDLVLYGAATLRLPIQGPGVCGRSGSN